MIQFVYFDVGGVVVKDFSGNDKWAQMKHDLGLRPEDEKEFDKLYNEYEKEVCIGRDVDSLIPLIKKRFDLDLPKNYSMQEYFLDRFEKNEFILPIIERIKRDCKIGLLTNMYPGMLSEIRKRGIMPETDWDIIIDSTIEKCRKPDLAIFKLAEERSNAKKENILFIDNKLKNIEVARIFGWQTFFYDSADHKKSCLDLMDYYNKVK
jgi:HAD superfamily hydrolase (TIGR01509 family)